jgi:hypothetical protein
MIERSETLQLMDQLEAMVLKKGWPVPFTPYYLVHHEKMLSLMDQLRASLQDEMDGRFIKSFANANEAERTMYQSKQNKGKERSH